MGLFFLIIKMVVLLGSTFVMPLRGIGNGGKN